MSYPATVAARPGAGVRRLTALAVFAFMALFTAFSAAPAEAITASTLVTRVNAFVTHHPAGSQVGSGQCVALIHTYDSEVLGWSESGTPGDGGAHEWWDMYSSKAGLSTHYMKVSAGSTARKGDLAVYSTAVGGGYGHIAIVLADNGSSLKVIQQNWTRSLHVSIDSSMTKSHLLGYLRPRTS